MNYQKMIKTKFKIFNKMKNYKNYKYKVKNIINK